MDFLRRDRFAAIGAAKQWSSMNFVILDTETTDRGSLAHIVEFSCIDREGNILVDSLVNPGFPIPGDASAMHGITDADVAGKPCFPDLWPHVWDAIRGAESVCSNGQYHAPAGHRIAQDRRFCPGRSLWGVGSRG